MMLEKVAAKGDVVEIRRQYAVDCATIFHAWTNAAALKAWFGPNGVETREAEIDLCIGGEYRIEMHLPDGTVVERCGIYREIDPPTKLSFTWIISGQNCSDSTEGHIETLVSLRFRAMENGATELYLRHEGLPTAKDRDGHAFGWNGCCDGLHQHFADS